MREIYESDVLDLFGGTGNLGIEALSRGASSAVFSDKSSLCGEIIRNNLLHTKLIDKSEVIIGDAFNVLLGLASRKRKFDIVFLDPPYNKELVNKSLENLEKYEILKDGGIVVAEHDVNDNVPIEVGSIVKFRSQKYGDTIVSFYKNN